MTNLRAFQNTGLDLYIAGLNNTHSGNLSIRNQKTMFITRSGAMLHRLEYTDLVETLIERDDNESVKASRETLVHRSIYKNTDAQAIVHSHPPHLTALSMQYDEIKPVDAEGMYFFREGAPVISVTNAIASEEVAEKITGRFSSSKIVLVRGHGAFAIGADLEEGLHWTSSLEHSARILLLASQFAINSNFK